MATTLMCGVPTDYYYYYYYCYYYYYYYYYIKDNREKLQYCREKKTKYTYIDEIGAETGNRNWEQKLGTESKWCNYLLYFSFKVSLLSSKALRR